MSIPLLIVTFISGAVIGLYVSTITFYRMGLLDELFKDKKE
jgi:hypothetical protein